jgi:hypothetical protein
LLIAQSMVLVGIKPRFGSGEHAGRWYLPSDGKSATDDNCLFTCEGGGFHPEIVLRAIFQLA